MNDDGRTRHTEKEKNNPAISYRQWYDKQKDRSKQTVPMMTCSFNDDLYHDNDNKRTGLHSI